MSHRGGVYWHNRPVLMGYFTISANEPRWPSAARNPVEGGLSVCPAAPVPRRQPMYSFVTAIGIANPPHQTTQNKFADFYADLVDLGEAERRKLKVFYRYTRISTRYSVLPDFNRRKGAFTFFSNGERGQPVPSVGRRMELFEEHAAGLALEAARECLARAGGLDPTEVDHLITVSSTGMYAPGLDIDLIEGLGLRTTVERTAINFMGCFTAINALRVADSLCRGRPEFRVLIVNVGLPSIHFCGERDPEHLVSNALFGDGASAMLVEGKPTARPALGIGGFHSDLALRGKRDILWQIRSNGFEVKLSEYVPVIVKGDVRGIGDSKALSGSGSKVGRGVWLSEMPKSRGWRSRP